ncbi:MAG: zinc ribbon domain-containing protein [Ruminococcaceae bacterium]|nr:zinc ribbon domain-containing protein [Oscillospiraceae bacterium]
MPTCPNCNKQLAEGTKFCDSCGTPIPQTTFCPVCGRPAVVGASFCQGCGAALVTKPVEPAVQPVEPVAQPVTAAPVEEKPAQKKKFPKILLFGGIGLAVLTIVVVVLLLFKGGAATQQSAAIYIKDDQLYFLNLETGGEPWQVTDSLANNSDTAVTAIGNGIAFSKDGSRIFFPDKYEAGDDGINLYHRSTKNPEAEAVKVDSEIVNFRVNEAGTVVTYVKKDGGLYQYFVDKDEKEKIDSEVSEYDFSVSDDGNKLGYRVQDKTDSTYTYYLKYLGQEAIKIASGASSWYRLNEDMTVLYYMKEDVLYKQAEGQEKVKIASGVKEVLKIYESGELYYVEAETETVPLMDYVLDDKAAEDALITDYPQQPSTPYSWMYDTWDEYYAAYEVYQQEYAVYQQAYTAYWEKQDRDSLRNSLKNQTIEQSQYTLFFFDGKEAVKLTEGFVYDSYYSSSYQFAYEAPVVVYQARQKANIEKIKLSEVSYAYQVEDMVKEALNTAKSYYVASRSAVSAIDNDEATSFDLNDNGTQIFFMTDVNESVGDLYRIAINNGVVEKAEKYASDVSSYSGYFLGNDRYCYYKNYKDGIGDLYINGKKIANDVYTIDSYNEDADKLLYITDYNSEKESGTLYLYSNGESQKVDDDVSRYRITVSRDWNKILYSTDYSEKSGGTLKIWENGGSKKIADEVFGHTAAMQLDWSRIFFITERDGDNATLNVYENGEKTKIAEEMNTDNIDLTADGRFLYLTDYSENSGGDLYQWNGGEPQKLDEDVQRLYPYNYRYILYSQMYHAG